MAVLETKYYKDYGHNYMILRCGRQEPPGSYQHKILTSGRITGILACSVRYINGVAYYYYDISSRTTLENIYRNKKMSCGEVKDLLLGLHEISEKLAGYFMDESGLVLVPEHIYYDLTNKKYIGLYYPGYNVDGADTYKPLTQFLLEHIDTEDRDLAEKMYQICELSEENFFSIEEAIRILEEGEEEPVSGISPEAFCQKDWELPVADQADLYDVVQNTAQEVPFATSTQTALSTGRNLFYPVFAALSVLGIAGAAAIGIVYELTRQEQIILYGASAAMGACLLFCIAAIRKGARQKKSPPDNTYETHASKSGSRGKPDVEELPSLDRVIGRSAELRMAQQDPISYGNTVFFDAGTAAEYKLYATDRKNKNHIELKDFPCTIGKMAGCVDYVLADASVSRIHARFDRQGDKILLTDMNSTNGTYKNGLRMQPQETVEVEPGDEIRFGNLNYCYR